MHFLYVRIVLHPFLPYFYLHFYFWLILIFEVMADLDGLSQGAFPSHNSMSSDDTPLTP